MSRQQEDATTVWGCVLIGGKSSRMGTPKHLILQEGQTWVERTVALLQQLVDRVIIAGAGDVPSSLQALARVPDVPNIGGPLAGILSALRTFPQVSWLVVACDQPDMDPQALQWLLDCRGPGVLAVMPDVAGNGRVEPLLAYYDRSILPVLEDMAAEGHRRMNRLQTVSGVKSPRPPSHLLDSWHNINTPSELANACGYLPPSPPRHG